MNADYEIRMGEHHVRQGKAHIARQHQLIAHLRSLGADTALADEILSAFERTQMMHEDHLARARQRLTGESL